MSLPVNATLINLYHVCRRECWLHANGIRMESTSDTVYEGKLISETTYLDRARKYTELDLGPAKIDFYDAANRVVHEVKKSNKAEQAHEWQVKYYLLLLEEMGVEGPTGLLEYPKLKQRKEVHLEEGDREHLRQAVQDIQALVEGETCPPVINRPICKSCSYYEFCYVQEP